MTRAAAVTFPGEARLRSPRQFQATFSQGRRISTALFRLHLHLSDAPAGGQETAAEHGLARLGISVSKRVAASAVGRNRIKRIARDSFRHVRQQLPEGDYVLLAQRDAAVATNQALRDALGVLWQRATALKQPPATPTIPLRAAGSGESF